MQMTRRRALFVGAAGIVGLAYGSVLTRRVDDEVFRILRRSFGDRIADAPDTKIFVADVVELWNSLNTYRNQIIRPTFWQLESVSSAARYERAGFEKNVLNTFLRATNAVRAYETGTEEVQYLALPNPYEAPCANPLSNSWL